jgi:hypothetical protein
MAPALVLMLAAAAARNRYLPKPGSATLRLLAGGNNRALYAREHSISGCAQRNLQSRGRASDARLANVTQNRINPGQLRWSASVRRLSKHDCSGCFRLERLPGGACTHWKAPPCHGAHVDRSFRIATVDVAVGGKQSFAPRLLIRDSPAVAAVSAARTVCRISSSSPQPILHARVLADSNVEPHPR